ncbi:MAG: sialidase family protein [Bacteroidota bacterium]
MVSNNFFYGFLVTLIFIGMSSCNAQNKTENPQMAKPGEGACLIGELIYPLDAKPTPECHASTIVEVEGGMMAAWFGGTEEKHNDVGIWISMNLNGTWSKPIEVADGYQNDSLRYPCWNPVLFNPEGGPLMLFYKVGPNPRDWWGMLTTSDNGGCTWTNPVKLGENEKIGHLLGPVKNKPIQLQDGTIVCPSSTEINEDGETKWKVHFEFTHDFGKIWEVVGPINDGIEFDAIQPSIITYVDGKWQVLCRTRQGVVSQSWSSDNGQTWSKMTATALPNPNAGTDVVTLQDGRQLLVYNPTERAKGYSGRNHLNVAVSDDGIKWNDVLVLENDNLVNDDNNMEITDVGVVQRNTEYSYPAIIQAKDEMVYITYTYQRKSVKYVVVDPSRL